MGNRVSSMLASLATDVDDPLDRLEVIHDSMAGVKEQLKAIGADTLGDWAEFAAPAVAGRAARLYSRTRIADRHRPLFNVTISNIPGPPFPLYSIGARMVANFPIGPIAEGGGLNMTVMSYRDSLDFGLARLPRRPARRLSQIAEGLGLALDELVESTGVGDDEVAALTRSA